MSFVEIFQQLFCFCLTVGFNVAGHTFLLVVSVHLSLKLLDYALLAEFMD